MTTLIQFRRGLAGEWEAANPVLADGEPGFARDTGVLKIGDGVTPWVSLAIIGGGGTSTPTTVDGGDATSSFTGGAVDGGVATTVTFSVDIDAGGAI